MGLQSVRHNWVTDTFTFIFTWSLKVISWLQLTPGDNLRNYFTTICCGLYHIYRASLVAQTVKNLSAKQETQVRSLVQKDSLEKGMAIHCGILAWRIPWKEEPGRLQSMGSQRVVFTTDNEVISAFKSNHVIELILESHLQDSIPLDLLLVPKAV